MHYIITQRIQSIPKRTIGKIRFEKVKPETNKLAYIEVELDTIMNQF